ncbi:MAG: porin [Vogesella sp.]|uniref:porin n=1 Tax=Vogesella sp. TaxID=1904252 RepID=UPI00391CDB92
MKKLIVLATLAALPAAAMADVTISGNLAVGIVNTKATGAGSLTTENRTNGEIKFAGSDDLGNGLKAVWQIASRINLADQSNNARDNLWAGRDSYVGLDGSFGRVTAGNIYLMPNSGAMAIFENNSATFESAIYDQGTRFNNTVSYKSPNLAGFTATVQHSFGSNQANENAKFYADAVSLSYEAGNFAVSYDTAAEKENAQGKKLKIHELNGSVTLDALTLQAGFASGKSEASNTKVKGWGVAASYAMGNVTPKFGYWREGDSKTNGVTANDGHKAFAVGVEYALSKRTRTGVEFAKANYDAAGEGSLRTATVYLGTKF